MSKQAQAGSHHRPGSSTSGSFHGNILKESTERVFDKYEILQVLGQGSMGYVAKVKVRSGRVGGSATDPKRKKGLFAAFRKHKGPENPKEIEETSNHVYAIKTIIIEKVSPAFIQELENEIDILRSMDHPHIVKCHEVYKYQKQIYVILECCDGGDLYTRSPYSEKQAAKMISSVLSAVEYMHAHNIVHRDLKYENIMFESVSHDAAIKVIDFGLSKKFLGQPGIMTDRVGTIYTMSPQVLQGVYSSQADLWAVGVIAYMLLSTSKPFWHKKRRVLVDKIMRVSYTFDAPVWQGLSEQSKDFCSKLLLMDPKERMTAAMALQHAWITHREQLPDELPSEEILRSVDDSILNYKDSYFLKKIGLNVIAHRSSTKEIEELRKAFAAYDTSRNGVITFEEFKAAMTKMNYSDETIAEIFTSLDVNGNQKIMFTEFIAATIEARGLIAEDRIAEAFDRLDSDDSGYISKSNLKSFLGDDITDEECKKIMKEADTDQDGKISYKGKSRQGSLFVI
uniref:Calmodulin n=1 Tax=Amphora coffeiformis TaxID=265554 RepID=A0A7S3P976_9STRA